MNNSILKVILPLMLFLGFINSVVAQSDLEIVDNFNNEFTSIENTIKNASSLGDLECTSHLHITTHTSTPVCWFWLTKCDAMIIGKYTLSLRITNHAFVRD